jgi:hypothetical protein
MSQNACHAMCKSFEAVQIPQRSRLADNRKNESTAHMNAIPTQAGRHRIFVWPGRASI